MPADTELTDRELLVHIAARVEAMWAELESFRPLLAILRGRDGKPDMIGVLQARREARKAARGGT